MFTRRNERVAGERDERVVVDSDERAQTGRHDRARGLTRGVATLLGVASAAFLVWLATQVGDDSTGGYWAVYGLLAAAGLALALSQLLGGWTKWGWPRVSAGVFVLGFLPALIAGGWLLLANQPNDEWFRGDVLNWADDAGLGGLFDDLREYLPVVAFGLGLLFGFTFDTTGPRVAKPAVSGRRRREVRPAPVAERTDADEPLTAERRTVSDTTAEPEPEHGDGRRRFGRRRRVERDRDTAVAERPPQAEE